jgi:putative flavoprotein involved in K+ transport
MNTVVVGGGQAGLSVSHYLTQHAIEHVVLEQADKPGDAWRNHRWDSFTLNTPRWQSRFAGVRYGEEDPDGFMPKQEVVAYLDDLARRLPTRTGARVTSIARNKRGDYIVETDGRETIRACNVVVATGLYQTPKIPRLAHKFPAEIKQLHSDTYRNPRQLLSGAVLVVGSAQSGAQIAEELCESGRKVFLATGRAGRTPRRYRDKDANWWFARMGHYDRKVGELPSPRAKFAGKPHISGTKGGHTLNLHQFARDGVTLLGRLEGIEDGIVKLKGDLHDNLAEADRAEAEFVKAVDAYVASTGMAASEETLPVLRDGFDQRILTELDLAAAGITNVIWATGYTFDFSKIGLPVTDGDGFPIQTRGVSAYPGLFFVGLPWLHTAKSGLIFGVSEDARYIADRIAARRDESDDRRVPAPVSQAPARAKTSRIMTRWAAAAVVGLSITASHASHITSPPTLEHVATSARQLDLGMTGQQVLRIMGEPAKTTAFSMDSAEQCKLEFAGAVPTEIILTDGKMSSVKLDVFRPDKTNLPAFGRVAWPGLAESAVRHLLREPIEIRHHNLFGIDVDQWVFARSGQADLSVFFRAGRVIARAMGREVPDDLFRVALPSPPKAEGRMLAPRLGMTTNDIEELYGSPDYRVDYVFNGQPSSHAVYKVSVRGTFTALTFVDGVVTEFEDLGRMPDDPSFQGR